MQETSQLYNQIVSGEHEFRSRLIIDGVGTFGEDVLSAIASNHSLFPDKPAVGKAVAGEIDLTMLLPSVEIPPMAVLRPQTQAYNNEDQSEWLPQGVFFIDTRQRTKNENGLDVLTIHGYDAMLKAEQDFQSNVITGDSVDTAMVAEIARIMGVEVDSRTYSVMTNRFTIPLPTGYSCREVLGYIASMYVGWFVISDQGELRLVSMADLPPETNYLIDNVGSAITFGGDRILV